VCVVYSWTNCLLNYWMCGSFIHLHVYYLLSDLIFIIITKHSILSKKPHFVVLTKISFWKAKEPRSYQPKIYIFWSLNRIVLWWLPSNFLQYILFTLIFSQIFVLFSIWMIWEIQYNLSPFHDDLKVAFFMLVINQNYVLWWLFQYCWLWLKYSCEMKICA
jgi:hypothetical protein